MLATLLAAVTFARPNVVLVLVDDMGWQDTSLAFGLREKVTGRQFRTPNLEKLARRGLSVNQAYSSCPVCTPSRAALLSGVHPARSNILSWVQAGGETEETYPGLVNPKWKYEGFQPGDAVTLPELFRAAGYHTVQVGKAHFGSARTAGADPKNLGFDRSIGGAAAGHPSSYYGTDNFAGKTGKPAHNDVPDLEAYHGKDIFLEEALALEAGKEIEATAKAGKPLFLWFSPYAVHTPIMANKRLVGRYKNLDPAEAAYATLVESVDNALGSLVASLKKVGQLDNTYIIFTSDNGGLSMAARGGYLNLHNLPLRSGKGAAYEGGTRVPLVFAGPGIPRGKELKTTWMTGTDLSFTLADLAGITPRASDGSSYASQIRSGTDEARTAPAVWHFPLYRGGGGPGLEPFSSIRLGDFKAIFFYGDRRWELYNLKADIGETRDVSKTQPAKLRELADRLVVELDRLGAKYPRDAKTGQEVRPRL